MQKNWYIIHTKVGWEKKISASLARHKIESYVPVCYKQINRFGKVKSICKSIFDAYVLVKIKNDEIAEIQKLNGVISFVFWRQEPIRIPEMEVDALRNFLRDYRDVRAEKIVIQQSEFIAVKDEMEYTRRGNLVKVKNTKITLNLPSFGFQLIAVGHSEDIMRNESILHGTEIQLQS